MSAKIAAGISSPSRTGGDVAPRSGDGEGELQKHHHFFAFFLGFSVFAFSADFDTFGLAALPSCFT